MALVIHNHTVGSTLLTIGYIIYIFITYSSIDGTVTSTDSGQNHLQLVLYSGERWYCLLLHT